MDAFRLAPVVLCLLAAIFASILGGFVGVALGCWGSCEPVPVTLWSTALATPGAFFALCHLAFLRVLRGRVPYGTWHGFWAGVCTLFLVLGALLLMWDALISNWGRPQEAFLLLSTILLLLFHGLTMRALWLHARAVGD